MFQLTDLKKQRKEKRDEIQAIQDNSFKERRSLHPWETAQISTLTDCVREYDSQIGAIESKNTLRHQFPGGQILTVPERASQDAGYSRTGTAKVEEIWTDQETGREIPVLSKGQSYAEAMNIGVKPSFGFGDFVRGLALPTKNAELQAALYESGGVATGDVTVPIVLMGQLIDFMRAKTVCVQAGALTIPIESETASIARVSADPVPGWRNENAAFAESAPTFEKVTFTPKSLGVLIKVSLELLEDSLNVNQAIMQCFAGSLAVELDRVCLFGTGTAPQPHGISGTTNVASVDMGTNGALLANYDPFVDAVQALLSSNAAMPTAAIMNPRTLTKAAKLKDTIGQPMERPDLIEDLPFLSTNSVPINQTHGTATTASESIVGDFTQLMIGVRHQLRIRLLQERFLADNGQIGFLADLRADIQLRHPQSFCEVLGLL